MAILVVAPSTEGCQIHVAEKIRESITRTPHRIHNLRCILWGNLGLILQLEDEIRSTCSS